MPKRKQIDRDAIEREYRAGQLSNVEIAKAHGITEGYIRKIAKKEGWEKDLAGKVQRRVREKLVRDEVRSSTTNDNQIVEETAERGANIIRLHRKDVQDGRELIAILLLQLKDISTDNKDTAVLAKHAGIIRDLSVAQKNTFGLERQAYNLNDGADPGTDPDSVTVTFHRVNKPNSEE